jgi:hypothetical protein
MRHWRKRRQFPSSAKASACFCKPGDLSRTDCTIEIYGIQWEKLSVESLTNALILLVARVVEWQTRQT